MKKVNFIFEDIGNRVNFESCNDVNTSGIRRFWVSPLLNAAAVYHSFYPKDNHTQFYNIHDDLTSVENYIICSAVNHSPDDWTGYDPKVKSLFSFLNEKYLTDLKNGIALLMLDSSFEGYQTKWLFDWFHTECKNYEISPKQIVYVTGNMVVDDIYQDWCNNNNITEKMKVIGYSHFELDVAMTTKGKIREYKPLPSFEDNVVYKLENLSKIKTYACQNKRIRYQRIWFYKYLHDSGLLDRGIVSMNNFPIYDYEWEGAYMTGHEAKNLNDTLPKLIYDKRNDELDDNYYIRRFNDQVCLDTYLTVISEAQCGDSDETMFISEKTFKVIACSHPFMVMGNKNTMSKLREMGYKTFNGLIDEEYDHLPTHERMQHIIKSINNVDKIENKLDWYLSAKEVVKYNHDVLIGKLDKTPVAFQEVLDYYKEMFPLNNEIYIPKLI